MKLARRSRASRETQWFYFFISPFLLGLILLQLIPLLLGLLTSFTDYDGFTPIIDVKWLGLQNYNRAWHDVDAIWGLQRTFLYALFVVPVKLLIAFMLAVMLQRLVAGRSFFSVAYYLPGIIPTVGTVWVWRLLLEKDSGIINAFFSVFRPGTAINWIKLYPMQVLWMISLWGSIGGATVLFLAALQSVPKELEESARIDGADNLRLFRFITAPLITPVIFFQLVTEIIACLQVAMVPLLLAGSNLAAATIPPRGAYTFMLHAIRQNFTFYRFGYGSALVWLFVILILILTLIVFQTQRYWVFYEFDQEGKKS